MRSAEFRRAARRSLGAAGIAVWVAGCGGSGVLHLAPLNQNRIERNEALITEVGPAPCAYSVNGETITIALEHENISLIGAYGKRLDSLSLVVHGLPADKSRDYKLDRTSIRGRLRRGAHHVRFASMSGILGLWFEPDGRLRGRFRAVVKQQQFNVISGWSGDARVLAVGEFSATKDAGRVQAIRDRTESDGLARTPASQPARSRS